ncbi:MAG: sulfatase-like hydrolase/transferase, partial [Lentisphaeria bacterium]|nr:sulfatase-like hydrolase/transferase [Lentisphaeria bacterium]
PVIKTPNLDRLVNEGTAFTNAFTPSPVCSPARQCFQYGLYPGKTGQASHGQWMPDNGNSYPEILSRAGYHTKAIGKCHFSPGGRETMRGFDERITQEECQNDIDADDYLGWLHENNLDTYEAHGARGDMYYIPQIATHRDGAHPTGWIGDRSVEFIEEASTQGKPWMLYSSFIHPHPPFAPPKPWHKLYRPNDMPMPFVPDDSESMYTWINYHQNRYKWRDNGIDYNLLRTIKAYYYAAISFVDYQVGKMLDALEKNGQLDNTLIVFSSDHGEYLGDYHCFGKRSMHDCSSKVPFIVRYPERFAANQQCDSPVSLVDLLPTFAATAGADIKGVELDGIDVATVADGSADREMVFSHFGATLNEQAGHAIYMAVNKTHKYVYSTGDKKAWLFDRVDDPQESHSIADSSDGVPIASVMKQALLAHLQVQGVRCAFTESPDGLDWADIEPKDMSDLDDPDANLLLQDYPTYDLGLPEYK